VCGVPETACRWNVDQASPQQEVESSVTLQNKEFSQVHNKFIEHGWELTTNTQRQLTYSYPMSAYDEFNISIESNGISVCTPVPLGNFAYRVKLNTHDEAVIHILSQLEDFESKRNNKRF
jgi:hypothetical protein